MGDSLMWGSGVELSRDYKLVILIQFYYRKFMISVLMELGQNKVEGAEDFFYVFNSFFFFLPIYW